MHISRTAIVTPHHDHLPRQEAAQSGGIRLALATAAAIALGLALTLWLAAMQLTPAAPCLADPGAVCEPF